MKKTLFLFVVFFSALTVASAGEVSFLPATGADLVPAALSTQAVASKSLPSVSMDAVDYCWPLEKDAVIDSRPAPFVAVSREYLLRVSSKDLRSGIDLPTTVPGALVRLNPSGSARLGKALSIDPTSIVLTSPEGKKMLNGEGMEKLADADAMKAAGAPFAEGTSAFRLAPSLGSGIFRIAVPSANGTSGWVIHVLEKDSPIALVARTNRNAYLTGQSVRASFKLDGVEKIDRIQAELHSPSGESRRLEVDRNDGNSFEIDTAVKNAELSDGLWEIHVGIETNSAEGKVLRNVHTAFAVSSPTARFLKRADVSTDAGLAIELPVEAAAPGRFAAQGVLFATDAEGKLCPIAVCQSADYLAPGVSSLHLNFDSSLIEGFSAPFEIRDLQLMDQGRMGQLYRQARALVIE